MKKKSKLSKNFVIAYKIAILIVGVAVAIAEIKDLLKEEQNDSE
jgi:hypothetical protein